MKVGPRFARSLRERGEASLPLVQLVSLNTSRPPFDNLNLRKAVNFAVNRSLLAQLSSGAQELSTDETSIDLVFSSSLWQDRVVEFVALLPGVLPDLRAEIRDDPHLLALLIRGAGTDHDRLAVALQQWRRTVSRA